MSLLGKGPLLNLPGLDAALAKMDTQDLRQRLLARAEGSFTSTAQLYKLLIIGLIILFPVVFYLRSTGKIEFDDKVLFAILAMDCIAIVASYFDFQKKRSQIEAIYRKYGFDPSHILSKFKLF